MKQLPLVSIITPCYNGENYVTPFIKSVLLQSYNNIEFIFINDGSTDNTEKIVLDYEPEFKERGIKFKYIYQENQGQAAALNNGLKIFTGDYLTWPDSDDILHPDNISKRVNYLIENSDVNLVLSKSIGYDDDLNITREFSRNTNKPSENIFIDLLLAKNIYFAGGAYMVRSNVFIKNNKGKNIYISKGGQNWQMLLPITYFNKCHFLDDYLYFIYERNDSHSRSNDNYKKVGNRLLEHVNILLNTINKLDIDNKDYYRELVVNKYFTKIFNLGILNKDNTFIRNALELKKGKIRIWHRVLVQIYNTPFIYLFFLISKAFSLLKKIFRKIKSKNKVTLQNNRLSNYFDNEDDFNTIFSDFDKE